ncbi:hypothetical protein [Paraburkholderia rhynchosiae]|uniref:Uncharacterized protein n=1 Tax=Paraburkholderia rhynchosiae TaxID=487049 RepID=A0A2N7WHI5_9BURK|nr:hypothetical protein [Paraburkholderia rhynchosiae]PMS28877.1 hypothetical protein C0Z16_20830 [Paraburkholderia rhynchosiae]CAB3665343.1 hypothetical protein LMG27174_01852 [Paraburkholderia rhynchosiae]
MATACADVDAAYLNGYRAAIADVARGGLSGYALQVARDIRMQLGLLSGMYRRGDSQAIASVFRAIDALMDDPAFGTLARREPRLFWAVATTGKKD